MRSRLMAVLTAAASFLGDAILVPVSEVGSLAVGVGWLSTCLAERAPRAALGANRRTRGGDGMGGRGRVGGGHRDEGHCRGSPAASPERSGSRFLGWSGLAAAFWATRRRTRVWRSRPQPAKVAASARSFSVSSWRVVVDAMDADPERPANRSLRVAHGHDDRAVDAGLFRSGPNVAARVGLDVARGDRGVALGGEARHPLADGHPLHDLDDVRRQAHLALENEDAVLQQVQCPRIRLESPDDALEALLLFETLLHAVCKRSTQVPRGVRQSAGLDRALEA